MLCGPGSVCSKVVAKGGERPVRAAFGGRSNLGLQQIAEDAQRFVLGLRLESTTF